MAAYGVILVFKILSSLPTANLIHQLTGDSNTLFSVKTAAAEAGGEDGDCRHGGRRG